MKYLFVCLIVLALPPVLGITNVRLLAANSRFYEWGFRRHQVARVTGLSSEQLATVAHEFIRYFQGPLGRLDVRVTIDGQARPLFNEREIAHMVDVQLLMQRLGAVQLAGALLIAVSLLVLALLEHRFLGPTAGRALMWGSLLTIGVLAVLGLAAATSFDAFWTRFHLIAFTNDLWLLDPARDNLIRIYPPEFWADAVLLVAALTAIEAVLLAVLGVLSIKQVIGVAFGAAATPAARPPTA
jgi:integral membrane protein (TIGR01906 family)